MLSTRGMVLAVGALLSALAGLVYGVEEFVFVAIVVAVLLAFGAVSVWSRQVLSRRSLHLVMKVPVAEVTSGQSALVELTVTNGGRRRLPPVLVEDSSGHWSVSHPGLGQHSVGGTSGRDTGEAPITRGFTALGDRSSATGWLGNPGPRPDRRARARYRRAVSGARGLPDLDPGAAVTFSILVPTHTRGLLTLSGLGLWCEDPFGLVARRVTLAPPAHVVVYPVPAGVSHQERRLPTHAGARARSSKSAPTNGLSGDELSGLRPYQPGDRLTRLHWPSLARSGELVVREFLEPQAGSVALLVDLRPSAHSGDSIERTIARAAGFGIGALERGLSVELCTSTGDRMVITPDAAGRRAMLRALALLGAASAPPAVVRRWGSRPTGGAVWATGSVVGDDVVLVTTAAGAAERTLPDSIGRNAETVLVP